MLAKIEWNPTQKSLRVFGITLLVMFALLGLLVFFKTGKVAYSGSLCGIGVAVFAAVYLLPKFAGLALYRAWMGLAFVMGWVVGPIMMGIMFFCIITPMGLLRRCVGADTLFKNKNGVKSFWRPLTHRTNAGSYRRQF